MRRQLNKPKDSSAIKFTMHVADEERPFISELKRGDTFLRMDMVCMKTEVCLQGEGKVVGNWILNLQTGRVWQVDDEQVDLVSISAEVTAKGARK